MPSESPFEVSVHSTGARTVVVEVAGELDMSTLPRFSAALRGLVGEGTLDTIIIDAARLVFADSSAVQALIEARAVTDAEGATLRLTNVGGSFGRVLEMTGLDRVFEVA